MLLQIFRNLRPGHARREDHQGGDSRTIVEPDSSAVPPGQVGVLQRDESGQVPYWSLAMDDLRTGIWLVTPFIVARGTRSRRFYRFTPQHVAPDMLGRLFAADGDLIDVRIRQLRRSVPALSPDDLQRLTRMSLLQIAARIREGITAGLGGPPPTSDRLPVPTTLLREVPDLASFVDGVKSEVARRGPELIERLIGPDGGLVILDGVMHTVPNTRPSDAPQLLWHRRRIGRIKVPVPLIPLDAVKPATLSLDDALRRMDLVAEQAIEAQCLAAESGLGRSVNRVRAFLADCAGRADDWNGHTFEFDRGPNHKIVVTFEQVCVTRESRQPWCVSSPNGAVYLFPGDKIRMEVSAVGRIHAVRVLEPALHRYVRESGEMCIPEAESRISEWEQDPSVSLGQLVARVFRLYEGTLRLGGVRNATGGVRDLESLEPYRVADPSRLPPSIPFYPFDGEAAQPSEVRPGDGSGETESDD